MNATQTPKTSRLSWTEVMPGHVVVRRNGKRVATLDRNNSGRWVAWLPVPGSPTHTYRTLSTAKVHVRGMLCG